MRDEFSSRSGAAWPAGPYCGLPALKSPGGGLLALSRALIRAPIGPRRRAARHQLRRTRTATRVAAERLGAAPGRILAMETPRRPKPPQGDARGWLRRDPVSHAHEAAAAARREAREGAPRGPRPWEMAHTLARAHDTATCASLHRASAQGRSTDRRTASPPGPLGPPRTHAFKRTGMPLQIR